MAFTQQQLAGMIKKVAVPLDAQYSTFSGADIVATITVPFITRDSTNGHKVMGSRPLVIGSLQTITVSGHREKFPVRAFGDPRPRGFTRGPRTIGGSLIFTMFDRSSLDEVASETISYYNNAQVQYARGTGNVPLPSYLRYLLNDELPPFDVTITFANEYGVSSKMVIYGVEVVDYGQTMSIDDLFVEETMSYMARDITPMYPSTPFSVDRSR